MIKTNQMRAAACGSMALTLLGLVPGCSRADGDSKIASPAATGAPANFQLVRNPQGGSFIYGTLPGHGSLADAIVYVLQQSHAYFGERPQPGKFFRSRNGDSVAAFFTVNAHTTPVQPLTGLLIVNHTADGSASAAVLFDERARFATSEPKLLKALAKSWSAAALPGTATTRSPDRSDSARGVVAPLTSSTGGDGSASIGLPAGWKIVQVAGGSLTAAGPDGELVFMGLLYQGVPLGPDLFTDFVNLSNRFRSSHGLPAGAYTVTERKVLSQRAVQVRYRVDFHDGPGPRSGSVRLDLWGPQALAASGSFLPERLADKEGATLLAVIKSYQTNAQVVGRMQQGALNRVHADAARAAAQGAALNARREASNAAFDQHMNALDAQSNAFDAHVDTIDRQSKMTQDYILDRSVMRDNDNGDRGTVTNGYADYLLKTNPDRFEVVPNQDLIRGRDY
jgi:hypothetical protein